MRFWAAAYTALAVLALATPASAAQGVPVSRVAAIGHLSYAWLGPEGAATLTGPGLVVLLRPGDVRYEVNDRTEVASAPPTYSGTELFVSPSLAAHLEDLGRKADLAAASSLSQQQVFEQANSPLAPMIRGTMTLDAHQLKGAEALLVTGTAPPGVPVMVTLVATISEDLPNIVVSRHTLQTDGRGHFQAVVPIGPDYVRNSVLNVIATSTPGVAESSMQVTVLPANAGFKSLVDPQTSGIW